MKKILAIVLLLSVLLCSCGNRPENSSSKADDESSALSSSRNESSKPQNNNDAKAKEREALQKRFLALQEVAFEADKKEYEKESGKTRVSPRAFEGYIDLGNNKYEFYYATEKREFLIDVVKDQAEYDFLAEIYKIPGRLLYNGNEYWRDNRENGNGYSRFLGYENYGLKITMEYKNEQATLISVEKYDKRPKKYSEFPEILMK